MKRDVGHTLAELRIDRDLILEFFLTFSRFEFALKLTGFAKGDEDRVDPDWEKSAVSVRHSFDRNRNPALASACELFDVNPPRKQVLLDGKLAWNASLPRAGDSDAERFIALVKRVRNNLFHGGKYNADLHEEVARSEQLLRGSICILEECLRISCDVRRAYEADA
jgi:hypothetical protein